MKLEVLFTPIKNYDFSTLENYLSNDYVFVKCNRYQFTEIRRYLAILSNLGIIVRLIGENKEEIDFVNSFYSSDLKF